MRTKDHSIRKKSEALQSPEVGGLVKIAAVENIPAGADEVRHE
jgi:hypothetical protein